MKKINTDEIFNKKAETIFETGFNDIDEIMRNVEKGSIITIGGRPSMGKTSFALSIVNRLLENNRKIFYFSPSMKSEYIAKRLVAIKLGINHFDLLKLKTVEKSGCEFFSKKELYFNDKIDLTVGEIEEKIKNGLPDVAFIDYIQLLKMPKAPNFTDSINLAVQELKKIASETGVIFVILTQLSRGVECRIDKRPLLCDIRNSSLLEELSDVVMMIYRDEYYNPDAIENKGIAEIIFRKNNFGPTDCTVNLIFNGIFANRRITTNFRRIVNAENLFGL